MENFLKKLNKPKGADSVCYMVMWVVLLHLRLVK